MSAGLPYYSFQVVDWQFAKLLTKLAGAEDQEKLKYLLAYVSQATRNGHVCVDVRRLPPNVMGENFSFEDIKTYGLIGKPGENTPLILDQDRLYLERYWQYEQKLAELLTARSQDMEILTLPEKITAYVERNFPTGNINDRQFMAVLMSTVKKLLLITGGPGTGKTRTIAEILRLFHELMPSIRVAVCTPTGKASQRMTQALRECNLPITAMTIDRLLGYIPHQTDFRHTAENPLPTDVLIVDEASMVALGMMVKLLSACSPNTRVILVGDPGQLVSVETGNVLGDIVAAAGKNDSHLTFSLPLIKNLCTLWPKLKLEQKASSKMQSMSPLLDCHIRLIKEYRFEESGFLSRAAKAVQEKKIEEFWEILADPTNQEVTFQDVETPTEVLQQISDMSARFFLKRKDTALISEKLEQLKETAILCAIRGGKNGVENINAVIERRILNELGFSAQTSFYEGKPLLITENSYEKKLFNGDVGVVQKKALNSEQWEVSFLAADGILSVSVLQLPTYEIAYAITIHKSQGSEFNTVWVILPFEKMPILGRELIYTALTRAKKSVVFLGKKEILSFAISNSTCRKSGLYDALVSKVASKGEMDAKSAN